MDRLELKPRSKLTVNFEGVDYPVNRPSLGVLADFEEKMEEVKKTKKGVIRFMLGFVVDCGVPKEIAAKFNSEDLEQIVDLVSGVKKN